MRGNSNIDAIDEFGTLPVATAYALKGQSVQAFLVDSSAESIEAFLENVKTHNMAYHAMVIVWDNFSSHHANHLQATAENWESIWYFRHPSLSTLIRKRICGKV